MRGDQLRIGPVGGEQLRGPAVVAGTTGRRPALVDGVAHERVREARRLAGLQHPGRREPVERGVGRRLVDARQGPGVASGRLVAEHGAGGDQPLRLRPQAAQAGLDRSRDPDRFLAPESLEGIRRHALVPLAQDRGELRHQQRVAAGEASALRGGGRLDGARRPGFQQLLDALRPQGAEADDLGRRLSPQLRQGVRIGRLLAESRCRYERDPGPLEAPRDRRQRPQAGGVGPVDVVDEQCHRLPGAAALAELRQAQADQCRRVLVGLVDPLLGVERAGDRGGHPLAVRAPVEQRSQQVEHEPEGDPGGKRRGRRAQRAHPRLAGELPGDSEQVRLPGPRDSLEDHADAAAVPG